MGIQTPKSSTQYASEVLANLQATGVTNTTPGGKARGLADTIADRMGLCETNTFILASQNFLPFATGDALDALGAIYNVPRLTAQNASSPATDGNFEFFVQTGTFGSINSGQDIVIPAGTQLFSSGVSGALYSVDVTYTLPAASSSFFVSASSIATGSAGNAPATVINQSNFSNYAQVSFGTLLVTNNFAIIAGSDPEDDESYRFRINLKLQSTGGNAQVDIQAAILQIPGVQNVVFNPLAGTFQVYVYGISPVVPQSLLSLVQTAIDANTAYPLNGTAIVPDLVGISLATTLTLAPGLSVADQSSIISTAQQAAANYINNLAIGQELVINQIASIILTSSTSIIDIGDPNNPIQAIYIWRTRSDGSQYSSFLVNDYTPAVGERIVVQNIDNPINLTVATTT